MNIVVGPVVRLTLGELEQCERFVDERNGRHERKGTDRWKDYSSGAQREATKLKRQNLSVVGELAFNRYFGLPMDWSTTSSKREDAVVYLDGVKKTVDVKTSENILTALNVELWKKEEARCCDVYVLCVKRSEYEIEIAGWAHAAEVFQEERKHEEIYAGTGPFFAFPRGLLKSVKLLRGRP